ncbi:MAG TPA: ATP-binding cassette domain-containing protein, partial [Candidatus Methylomirabilis sp.]|nr:ATP-binding cassette domain-containing protein [Candidatus Methylomirabilis sp.]
FKGHGVTGLSPHRIARMGLGRTFQIPALFRKMTVEENLWVPAIDETWGAMRRRAVELLEFFRLTPLRDEPAEVLSGGQQKVLELARALMRDPDLLLLDECTAGVQPAMVAELLQAIRRLRERGKAFVIIEHNMDVIQDLCEEIVVMHEGRAIARGDLSAVKRDAAVVEAYLGR